MQKYSNQKLEYLEYEPRLQDIFEEPSILTFGRKKKLHVLLECENILNGKIQRQTNNNKMDFFNKIFLQMRKPVLQTSFSYTTFQKQ